MATVLRSKSFQKNLLMSIGGIFILFAACFNIYQYKREKEYKADIMHSSLQTFNYELAWALGEERPLNDSLFRDFMNSHKMEGLRVSVIALDGHVLMDSQKAIADSLGNHLRRHEIEQAIREGNGYDIKRTSESTHETYFYSATLMGDIIIRTAIPYSAQLTKSLQADNTFLYYAIGLTLMLGLALYWNTHRITRHIEYLRQFALKAENSREIDHDLESRLPDDELGEISHTITQLFRRLRHSEEEKTRIKRQLTQNAAHELKTPAASIHGYLESIIENPQMDEKQRQYFIERCYAQSERMNKLLLDMSALTKLDEMGEGMTARREDYPIVDVVQTIDTALADTSLQLQEKKIEAKVSLPDKITLRGDQSLIYSIFRNLIDNALAYATGATEIRIECEERKEDGKRMYLFTFSDNGAGVEPQHLPHLFERFYRVDKGRSRKMGGTGLGLAIVKNAVATHGGTTTASLTPGGGLTVRFGMKKNE